MVSVQAFWARAYKGHPYGRPPSGTPETVGVIDREDLLAAHREMMSRGRLNMTVVGAIGADALAQALDRLFLGLPELSLQAVAPVVLQGLGEVLVARLEGPQSSITFGRPAFGSNDPDYLASLAVNLCLGGQRAQSRLYEELREKRGLCYSVWTSIQTLKGASMLYGSTSTRNDTAGEALDVIRAETVRLLTSKIGIEELERAKGNLIGAYALRFDTSSAIADQLLAIKCEGRAVSWLNERSRSILAISPEQVSRTIERLLGDTSLLVSIAGEPVL
jgi:zinc protease